MTDVPEAVPSALIAYPGDFLILGFARPLSPDVIDRIRERARSQMPGLHVLVIDQVTHMAIYRPSPEGDTT